MDISEAFRGEDISKTDFFDFVGAPEAADGSSTPASSGSPSITTAPYAKQMRSVNAFLGSTGSSGSTSTTPADQKQEDAMLGHSLAEAPSSTEAAQAFDAGFWSCDKETVRLETAILEDLNKYCWSQEDGSHQKAGVNSTNSDGHIYTLTVLNGVDQAGAWYRAKEDDAAIPSPSPMEAIPQPPLDIESILSTIPGQMNGFSAEFNGNGHSLSPNTDGLIKSEPYAYDDSGYDDNKEWITTSLVIDTPLLEAHDTFNNNNNDWKLTNNNNNNNSGSNSNPPANSGPNAPGEPGGGGAPPGAQTAEGNAESLLRNALQGKTFVRYNDIYKRYIQKTMKLEPHSELKRALSTPPGKGDGAVFADPTKEGDGAQLISILDPGVGMFDEAGAGRGSDSDNPASAHSMDDILLSQLDAASYPEDYEKLKRIANEVAESVQQFCQIDPQQPPHPQQQQQQQPSVEGICSITADQIGIIGQIAASPIISTAATSSTKSGQPKKYKRSNSGASGKANSTTSSGGGGGGSNGVQTATSTSNGVRKERSLHYCSICSKGFKDKYSVNVHIRTHTGEKPFSCSLCGKSFRQKAHLAKHYQTHIAQKNATAAAAAKAKTR